MDLIKVILAEGDSWTAGDIIDPEIQEDLNQDIWTSDKKLDPEISEKLLKIARDFYESLGLPPLERYTPVSDNSHSVCVVRCADLPTG